MPSQAETIAALQGLNPVTTPQSPADPYAAAMTFGSAIGLPDAIKALKGQMTPEEAKTFALTSAVGLLPGARAEAVAEKTMNELVPHLFAAKGPTEKFGKMTAPQYVKALGIAPSDLKNMPPNLAKAVSPALGLDPTAVTGFVPKPITQAEIDKKLAANPGASIFDVADTHVGGASQPYTPKPDPFNLKDAVDYSSIPREATPYAPVAAKILGRSQNLVHGTRVPLNDWEGGVDKLQLPDNELGVHFGNPKQASIFTGSHVSQFDDPRSYSVVVAVNNPLRMPDLGSWGIDGVQRQLMKTFPEDKHIINAMEEIDDARKYIQSKGYDSVIYKNTEEDPGHDSIIKFTESPVDPGFVTGVRSPWAAFDPTKLSHASLAAGLAGGTLAAPAIDPNLLKALTGSPTDQQQ
jgi:hypothetical protein